MLAELIRCQFRTRISREAQFMLTGIQANPILHLMCIFQVKRAADILRCSLSTLNHDIAYETEPIGFISARSEYAYICKCPSVVTRAHTGVLSASLLVSLFSAANVTTVSGRIFSGISAIVFHSPALYVDVPAEKIIVTI